MSAIPDTTHPPRPAPGAGPLARQALAVAALATLGAASLIGGAAASRELGRGRAAARAPVPDVPVARVADTGAHPDKGESPPKDGAGAQAEGAPAASEPEAETRASLAPADRGGARPARRDRGRRPKRRSRARASSSRAERGVRGGKGRGRARALDPPAPLERAERVDPARLARCWVHASGELEASPIDVDVVVGPSGAIDKASVRAGRQVAIETGQVARCIEGALLGRAPAVRPPGGSGPMTITVPWPRAWDMGEGAPPGASATERALDAHAPGAPGGTPSGA